MDTAPSALPSVAAAVPRPPPELAAIVDAPALPFLSVAWGWTQRAGGGTYAAGRLAACLAYLTSRHRGLIETGQLALVDRAESLRADGAEPPPMSLMGQLRAESAAILTGRVSAPRYPQPEVAARAAASAGDAVSDPGGEAQVDADGPAWSWPPVTWEAEAAVR